MVPALQSDPAEDAAMRRLLRLAEQLGWGKPWAVWFHAERVEAVWKWAEAHGVATITVGRRANQWLLRREFDRQAESTKVVDSLDADTLRAWRRWG